jgi:hypothetical protein
MYPFMYHIIGTYWAFHDKDLIVVSSMY